ncbi:MAG: ABC transporter ATP-binding protein, partial [Burkholderiales bacterium]
MSRVPLADEGTPALTVQGLTTWLDGSTGVVRALEGVGFTLATGKTIAIVGESGCGKSMTALSITRLLPESGRVVAGSVMLGQDDLLGLTESTMRSVRGRHVAMIFQEPATSLNPVLTVGGQIAEVLTRHTTLSSPEARTRAVYLLASVGIADPQRCAADYPFRLSGGMKQRVMIALALAAEPTVLIADEPTTALDVTTQAQVLELLREQQALRGMAMVLITHDLGVVSQMADWVAVMYAGEIVELAPRDRFFAAPQHPYSRKLFESVPGPHRRGQALAVIPGQVPALDGDFVGCRFVDRCIEGELRCRTQAPAWTRIAVSARTSGDDAHTVRCHAREASPAAALAMTTVMPSVAAPHALVDAAPLLQVRDLTVHFPVRKGLLKRVVGQVRAVDGVSFDIAAGETLALVGESGCGKTTVGKSILQLIRPTSGSVRYRGDELTTLPEDALRSRRGDLQIVFQDPFASLNPRMRVAEILAEGMESLGILDSAAARDRRVTELLDRVGLPKVAADRYPHEFSGGQRQR